MLRSSFPRIRISRILRRRIHSISHFEHLRNGIDGFLGKKAIEVAWLDYQNWLIQKLNFTIAGTADENKTSKELLIKYARDPEFAPTFNYASMAHNNAFFFEALAKEEVEIPKDLRASLEKSFVTMDSLKNEFMLHVASMFGPGFVWLVLQTSHAVQRSRPTEYALLTTYLAGSPYPGAHYRRQTQDMNTQNERSVVNSAGAMGGHSESAKKPELLGGFVSESSMTPILCINTWEHVWLHDYSFKQKRKYAADWWHRIDWNVVRQRVNRR